MKVYSSKNNMFIVVGLGNPGHEYTYTRHNIGFRVVNRLAKSIKIERIYSKYQSTIKEGLLNGKNLILAKPKTYMNLSGRAVSALVNGYKIPLSRLLIIYDDVDLELGRIRIKKQGGAGGHKGVSSVISYLQSNVFPRLKIGIGHPLEEMDIKDYVLSRFTPSEKEVIKESIKTASEAVISIIVEGIDKAMSKYNQRKG
ncbi:MAG: aminoacyl-tRNA hydrolase [bacterium]|nr:aminoacyl-tRNA hydrolase [bacterium]